MLDYKQFVCKKSWCRPPCTSYIAINESEFDLGLPLASLGVEFPADDVLSVNILPVVALTQCSWWSRAHNIAIFISHKLADLLVQISLSLTPAWLADNRWSSEKTSSAEYPLHTTLPLDFMVKWWYFLMPGSLLNSCPARYSSHWYVGTMTSPASVPHNCGTITLADEQADAADEMSARQSTHVFQKWRLNRTKRQYLQFFCLTLCLVVILWLLFAN